MPQLSLLALSIAAARFLGPARFGRQSFIAFVEVSAMTLFTAGLPIALARFIGEAIGRRRPGDVGALVRWTWKVEAVGALAGGALLAAIALRGAEPRAAWLLAALVVSVAVLQRVPTAVLTGLQRWRESAVVSVVIAVGVAVVTVIVLALGGGITGMFAVEAGAALTSFSWLLIIARRVRRGVATPGRLDRTLRAAVIRYAAVTGVGVVLTLIVWRRSEFFFLDRFSSDQQIGVYSVAFSAVTALIVAPQALTAAALPAVATLLGAGALDRIRAGFARAVRLLLLVSLPLTALSLALGPLAIRLVYGAGFRDSGAVMLILLAPFPLVALINLSNVVLSGMNRLRVPLVAGAVGAVVNVGLDLVLIPRFDAVGAALANVGGQLCAGLPPLYAALRVLRPVEWAPRRVARTALASAAAGAVAWALAGRGGVPGLLFGLVGGSLLLLVSALLLRIVGADDARWLRGATRRHVQDPG